MTAMIAGVGIPNGAGVLVLQDVLVIARYLGVQVERPCTSIAKDREDQHEGGDASEHGEDGEFVGCRAYLAESLPRKTLAR